jgi:predicted  nucleic acid-binding Zn-ribbon protein
VNRDGREDPSTGDNDEADDFKLAWEQTDDRWTEVIEDKGEFLVGAAPEAAENPASSSTDVGERVPWVDEESTQQVDEDSFIDRATTLLPDSDEEEAGPQPDDEAPPQGDPLEQRADEVFEDGRRPGARMDSLQDALSSIRERVQSLSSSVQASGPRAAQSSQLALYRAATDDRSYAELRRHSRDTEELLRRLSSLMQDLSLDLRSIVDAARRAIDQTSEQVESSIELGRLLGERIEQMDDRIGARLDGVDDALAQHGDTKAVAQRIEQIVTAIGTLQAHLDKRLTKVEQRAGVGLLREEMGEVRAELGDVRGDLESVRIEIGAVSADTGSVDLQKRLDVVGTQLDRTLTMLIELVEGGAGDADAVDGVMAAIKAETENAVEPFRTEVETLSQQLSDAMDREQQLGDTLATLTDEVQRLRKRIAVRAAPPTIADDQIQSIVDAVVVAVGGRRSAAATRRRAPEPEPEDDLDVEPEPEPKPKPRRKRTASRPVRATKAAPVKEEPDYEVDINEPFAAGELDLADSALDVEADEEPIRRARGSARKAPRPLTKGKRTRSTPR